MAETIGIEGRGGFYDEAGAIRDVIQNHMLEVLALLAMEPPISTDSEAIRDEKAKLMRAIRPLTREALVRGQYRGYLEERGVAPDSRTETFAAMRLHIDTWRWAGVPFLVRAGKRLPLAATEVRVTLRAPPYDLFHERRSDPTNNYYRFGLGPGQVRIDLGARVKSQGVALRGEDVSLQFCSSGGEETGAYERLLGDAIKGDTALFARQDSIEAAWKVVEPVLGSATPVHEYEPGTWGPADADAIAAPYGGWHEPVGATTLGEDESNAADFTAPIRDAS
jgi:glucose-6-phosphate 1-dehydrogenase